MAKIRKPRADSKLKNLPAGEQEALWELLHPQDPEATAWTLDALAVHASVAISTVSEWRAWYALNRRMEMAAQRANQTSIELAKNSDLTPEAIERVAQTVFTAEMLESGNVKGYVALAKLRLAADKQSIDRARLMAATKTKIEEGLEALFAEIKGNRKAEALFLQLQEVVSKA